MSRQGEGFFQHENVFYIPREVFFSPLGGLRERRKKKIPARGSTVLSSTKTRLAYSIHWSNWHCPRTFAHCQSQVKTRVLQGGLGMGNTGATEEVFGIRSEREGEFLLRLLSTPARYLHRLDRIFLSCGAGGADTRGLNLLFFHSRK